MSFEYKGWMPFSEALCIVFRKQTYAVVTFNDEAAVQSALTYDGEIFNGQEMRIRRFDPNLPKDQAYHAIASEG